MLSALMAALDERTARAVIEHRKAIRRPLTPHAAMLMARKLGATPDPNLAADTMIGNGWQGFEAEWLQKRASAGARSPPRKTDFQLRHEAAIAACDQFIFGEDHDQHTAHNSKHIDLGREDFEAF